MGEKIILTPRSLTDQFSNSTKATTAFAFTSLNALPKPTSKTAPTVSNSHSATSLASASPDPKAKPSKSSTKATKPSQIS